VGISFQTAKKEQSPPDESQVAVYVHDHASREEDFRGEPSPEAAELRRRVRFLAPGRYSLRVPFPQMDRSYTLAWKPVPDDGAADESRNETLGNAFGELARRHRDLLCLAFARVFWGTPLWGRATLALFAKAPGSGVLEHLLWVRLQGASLTGFDDLDISHHRLVHYLRWVRLQDVSLAGFDDLDIKSENHLLVRAWWGYMISRLRPSNDEKAREWGFLPNEVRLLCVPIRLGLGATNPSPWLIARLGIEKREGVDLLGAMDDSTMSLLVYEAISRLLATAFHLLGEDHG
jgi:hypothetical protein